MAEQKISKVEQLRPLAEGINLTVKIVSSKLITPRGGRSDGYQGRQSRLAECLVGDETGMIVFTARNDQVDLMKEGSTVTLRNAKIDVFKGSMRLVVDRSGHVEVTEPAEFKVDEKNNLSLVEFERVDVVI